MGSRGAISIWRWLPSLSCGWVAGAAIAAPAPKAVSARGFAPSGLIYRLPLTEMHSKLRLCIEVKDLTHPGLRPRPKGLRVFTRGRPTGSLHITAFERVKITFDYDK